MPTTKKATTKAAQREQIADDVRKFHANGGETKHYDADGNFVPKVKKLVTLPTLKLTTDVPVYVKVLEAIHTSRPSIDPRDKKEKTVELLNVINLETGESMQIVAGKVLCNVLTEEYPDHAYVDCGFEIKKGAKKGTGDKGYYPYSIAELDLD